LETSLSDNFTAYSQIIGNQESSIERNSFENNNVLLPWFHQLVNTFVQNNEKMMIEISKKLEECLVNQTEKIKNFLREMSSSPSIGFSSSKEFQFPLKSVEQFEVFLQKIDNVDFYSDMV
jgi:hypothetical protein